MPPNKLIKATWQIAEIFYRKARTQKERDVEWIRVATMKKIIRKIQKDSGSHKCIRILAYLEA